MKEKKGVSWIVSFFFGIGLIFLSYFSVRKALPSHATHLEKQFLSSDSYLPKIFSNSIDFDLYDIDVISHFSHDPQYLHECGYWIEQTRLWGDNLRFKNATDEDALIAVQDYSGLGDRVSGLIAIFNKALIFNVPFKIRWKNFRLGFDLTSNIIQDNNTYYGRIIDSGKHYNRDTCKKKLYYYKCKTMKEIDPACPLYLRACVTGKQCKSLSSYMKTNQPEVLPSISHVVGCPLRTLMQPATTLLQHQVSVFVSGKVYETKLQNLVVYMSNYRIISVHVRMGDYAFLKGLDDSTLDPVKAVSTKCLNMVEDEINSKTDKRPVLWFIASDDYKLKQFFMAKFPDKTITLTRKAHHILYVSRQTKEERQLETKDLFADWLLIGRGDELITNRAHKFGVSSFSRLSWLYSLKSSYYEFKSHHVHMENLEETTCFKRNFKYDGNFGEINRECKTKFKN